MLTSYIIHYKKNYQLAYPIVLAMAGQVAVGIADNIMVGRYVGVSPLAAASFANSIFINFLVFGIGFAYGLTPLIGAAFGEKNKNKVKALFKHGLLINTVLGIVLFILLILINPFLHLMGQTPDVVDQAIPYFNIISFSLIPFLIFLAFKQFSEGIASTKPVMYCTLSSNVINIILNYILINGGFGIEPMGLVGAGYATLISRIILMLSTIIYIYKAKYFTDYIDGVLNTGFNKRYIFEINKISFPTAFQTLAEIVAFSMGAVMMGWISEIALAAHQIAISMVSFTFMMANGLSAATTIRVSNLIGARKPKDMRLSAFASFHMVLAFMAFTGVVFFFGRDFFPTFFLKEVHTLKEQAIQLEVIRIAASLFIVAAFFQLSDGLHVVLAGALRGLKDIKFPVTIAFIAFWLISLPVGYVLAFHFGVKEIGIWVGYLAGLSFAAILLFIRFRRLSRRFIYEQNLSDIEHSVVI